MGSHENKLRLEIAIAASKTQQKYEDRLLEFKKFGLLNVTENIHVSLLLGPGEYDDYLNWPENVSVTAYQCRSHHPAIKINEYYRFILPSHNIDAQWYMKVDDDSITDIGSLLTNLEGFNEDAPLYLCAYLNSNISKEERQSLKNLNLESKLLKNVHSKIWHEWECAILNKQAIAKLLNSDIAQKIFEERLKFKSGSSDQTLGIACRANNIAPLDCDFLQKDPLAFHFSLCNGSISHIHYISKDVNAHMFEIVQMAIGEPEPPRPKRKLFSDKSFKFFSIINGNKNEICEVKLLPSGFVSGGNPNESMWTEYSGNLQFFREDSVLTTDFHHTGDGCFEGPYLRNRKIIHRLEPLDTEIIPIRVLL